MFIIIIITRGREEHFHADCHARKEMRQIGHISRQITHYVTLGHISLHLCFSVDRFR